jgi:O-antigen/teichoic acid export membrane protein
LAALKKLLGHTAIYGLSSILGRLLNYLLVPIHTAVFAAAEYGVVTEFYAEIAFLNVLYTFGLETTFFRFATKHADKTDKYFNVAESIIFTLALLFSAVIFLLAQDIANLLEYPDYAYAVRWIGLILAIDAIVALPFARLRLQSKAFKFASIKLANISINVLLNVLFLIVFPSLPESSFRELVYDPQIGVGYVFLANLLANATLLLFFAGRLFKVRLSFRWSEWKPLLVYAWPIVFLGFAGLTNEMFSRVMLKYLLPADFYPGLTNQEALGVFGACYKLSIFMSLAIQAFKYAYEPFFFKSSSDDDTAARKTYAEVMQAFVFFGGLAWVGISMILPELAPLFLQKKVYLSGLEVVPLLLGGGLFLGIYYNLSLWYKVTDRTRDGAAISVIGMIVTILGNLLLIPRLGYMGSAWTTLLTYLIMVIVSYVWGQQVYRVNYKVFEGLILIIISGTAAYFLVGLEEDVISRYLLGIVFLLVISVAYLVMSRFFRGKKQDNG